MTVTYTDDTLRDDPVHDEVFVPRYARTGRARKKGAVRAWMILAPVGALALIGGAAAVMMSGDTPERSPMVAETPAPAPRAAPLESSTAPWALAAGLPSNATITPTTPAATAPIVRETPPPAPAAIQRRQPAERRVATVDPAPAADPAPATPTGPQPYTATLNSQPAAAQPPAPAIDPSSLD